MNRMYQKLRLTGFSIALCCLGIVLFSGCARFQPPGSPSSGRQGYGVSPRLVNLAVSPNPSRAGAVINLITTYLDPDADLNFGIAAVSISGENLSRIAFHSTYPSGVLTIPIAVSYYSRPSDVPILLKIRDSSGNWSNTVSTTLSIR